MTSDVCGYMGESPFRRRSIGSLANCPHFSTGEGAIHARLRAAFRLWGAAAARSLAALGAGHRRLRQAGTLAQRFKDAGGCRDAKKV